MKRFAKWGCHVTALCPGSTESGFHAAALGENRIVTGKIASVGQEGLQNSDTKP